MTDDLGHSIVNANGEPLLVAYRCRIASRADLAFMEDWKQRSNGTLALPEEVQGIFSDSALGFGIQGNHDYRTRREGILAGAAGLASVPPPPGYVRIKPFPKEDDPDLSGPFVTP